MSTQLQQRGAAAPCVSRRTYRLSNGSSACNSGRPLSSAAARRQEARAAALQVVCSLNNSTGTMGERGGTMEALGAHLSCRHPPPAACLPTCPAPAASPAAILLSSFALGCAAPKPAKLEARETLRLALPSKGRMAEDTLQLLKVPSPACRLAIALCDLFRPVAHVVKRAAPRADSCPTMCRFCRMRRPPGASWHSSNRPGADCAHAWPCTPPAAAAQDCQLSVVKPNPRQYVARISQLPGLEVWFQRATGGCCGAQGRASHAAGPRVPTLSSVCGGQLAWRAVGCLFVSSCGPA